MPDDSWKLSIDANGVQTGGEKAIAALDRVVAAQERLIQATIKLDGQNQLIGASIKKQAGHFTTLRETHAKVDNELKKIATSVDTASAAMRRNTNAAYLQAGAYDKVSKSLGAIHKHFTQGKFAKVSAQASEKEKMAYDKARGALFDYADQMGLTKKTVVAAWRDINTKGTQPVYGEMSRLQQLLFNIKKSYQELGTEATKSARLQQASAAYKSASMGIGNYIRAAVPQEVRAYAARDEAKALVASHAQLLRLTREYGYGMADVNKHWEAVNKGATGTTERAMKYRAAIQAVQTAVRNMGQASKVAYQQQKKDMIAAQQQLVEQDRRQIIGRWVAGQAQPSMATATQAEMAGFARASKALADYAAKNNQTLRTIQGEWQDVAEKGPGAVGGKLFGLRQAIAGVQVAQGKLGEAQRREAAAQERALERQQKMQLTLSVDSMARLFAIQLLHRAVAALARGIADATRKAIEFDIVTSKIRAISQENQLSIQEWQKGLVKLSDSWGVDVLDQARAAYILISNQVAKGTEAINFLEAANRFGAATMTTAADATNLFSSAIMSWGTNASDVEHIAAVMFKTIELGRVEANEMANTLGRISVPAAQLGVSIEELGAAIATATIQGAKWEDASTWIRNIMLKLIRPTEAMKELLAEFGVASGEAALKAYGLPGLLAKIEQHTHGSSDELGELYGRIRAITGAMVYSNNGMRIYEKTLRGVTDSQGAYNRAVEIGMESAGKKLQILINQIKNYFLTDFGGVIKTILMVVHEHVYNLTDAVKGLAKALQVLLIPVLWKTVTWMRALSKANPLSAITFAAMGAIVAFNKMYDVMKRVREEAEKEFTKPLEDGIKKLTTRTEQLSLKLKTAFEDIGKATNRSTAEANAAHNAFVKEQIEKYKELTEAEKTATREAKRTAKEIIDAQTEVVKEYADGIKKLEKEIMSIRDKVLSIRVKRDEKAFDWLLEDASIDKKFSHIEARMLRLKRDAAAIQMSLAAEFQRGPAANEDKIKMLQGDQERITEEAVRLAEKKVELFLEARKELEKQLKAEKDIIKERKDGIEDYKNKYAELQRSIKEALREQKDAEGSINEARNKARFYTSEEARNKFKELLKLEEAEQREWKKKKANFDKIKDLQEQQRRLRGAISKEDLERLRQYHEQEIKGKEAAKKSEDELRKLQIKNAKDEREHRQKMQEWMEKIHETSVAVIAFAKLQKNLDAIRAGYMEEMTNLANGLIENQKAIAKIIEDQDKKHLEALEEEKKMKLILFDLENRIAEARGFKLDKVMEEKDVDAFNEQMNQQIKTIRDIIAKRGKLGMGETGDLSEDQIRDIIRLQSLLAQQKKLRKEEAPTDQAKKELEAIEYKIERLKKKGVSLSIPDTEINRLREQLVRLDETRIEQINKLQIDNIQERINIEIAANQKIVKDLEERLKTMKDRYEQVFKILQERLPIKDLSRLLTSREDYFGDKTEAVKGALKKYLEDPTIKNMKDLIKEMTDSMPKLEAKRKEYIKELIEQIKAEAKLAEKVAERLQQIQEAQKQLDERRQNMQDMVTTLNKGVADSAVAVKTFAEGVKTLDDNTAKLAGHIRELNAAIAEGNARNAVLGFKTGGRVPAAMGLNTRGYGRDTIPAMLTPGEFVVNPRATRQFYSRLVAMNAGGSPLTSSNVTVGDVNVTLNSAGPEYDARRLGQLLRREIRRGRVTI